jgi:hypothetical protein
MSIRAAILELLETHQPITDIVGNRIYPVKMADNDPVPGLIYGVTGGAQEMDLKQADPLVVGTFEIDCIVDDGQYPKLVSLNKAVVDRLSGFAGSASGVEIQLIKLDDDQDMFDFQSLKYVSTLEFTVWYTRGGT